MGGAGMLGTFSRSSPSCPAPPAGEAATIWRSPTSGVGHAASRPPVRRARGGPPARWRSRP